MLRTYGESFFSQCSESLSSALFYHSNLIDRTRKMPLVVVNPQTLRWSRQGDRLCFGFIAAAEISLLQKWDLDRKNIIDFCW